MSLEKVLYRAQATSTGGREGTSRSSDGILDVKLTTPKELAVLRLRETTLSQVTFVMGSGSSSIHPLLL